MNSTLNDYAEFTERMWFSGDGKPSMERDLPIMALGLAGETGEVVEHIKKLLRDGTITESELVKELGDVLYYWARICKFFDILPSDVIYANIEKLTSRMQRGVLRGNGDNR